MLHSTKYGREILWSGGITPRILDDGIRWRCAVNFSVLQLFSLIKANPVCTGYEAWCESENGQIVI